MATIETIKQEMHTASCAQLDVLLLEAQALLVSNPSLSVWFNNEVFREYNKRKFNNCGGVGLITPHDAGFRPI